jgi:hypothetical protein
MYFLESIIFIYKRVGNISDWTHLKVLLTTCLTLISSLDVAWEARPSIMD